MQKKRARPRFQMIYNIIKVHRVNIMYLLFGEVENGKWDRAIFNMKTRQ
jgi:hypothetical protein